MYAVRRLIFKDGNPRVEPGTIPAWKSTPTANSVPVMGIRASLLSFGSRATPRTPSWMEYIRKESTPKAGKHHLKAPDRGRAAPPPTHPSIVGYLHKTRGHYADCIRRCTSSSGCSPRWGGRAGNTLRCLPDTGFFLNVKHNRQTLGADRSLKPAPSTCVSEGQIKKWGYLSDPLCRTPSCESRRRSCSSGWPGSSHLSW